MDECSLGIIKDIYEYRMVFEDAIVRDYEGEMRRCDDGARRDKGKSSKL